jgi:hypothetical protein
MTKELSKGMTMIKRKFPVSFVATVLLAISGCSTNQPINDVVPKLQPGQGLAAIVIDTGQPISQVIVTPDSGSEKPLFIPSVPTGKHLYLFVADVGMYCMHHFDARNSSFNAKADDQCFNVDKGKISYGGVYTPFVGFSFSLSAFGAVSQSEDWDSFWSLLRSTYPNIAASAAPPTPETTAKKQPPAQPPSPTGICGLLSEEDASALLGVEVGPAQEDDTLIPTCTYTHSDQQAVHVSTILRGDLNGGTMDAVTPDHHYGWASWTAIPGLGDDARFTSRGSTYELLVLGKKKFILMVTVEGVQINDMQDAMTHIAKAAMSKLSN